VSTETTLLDKALPLIVPPEPGKPKPQKSFFEKVSFYLFFIWLILSNFPAIAVFIYRHGRRSTHAKKCDAISQVVSEISKKKKNAQFGIVGYCYGGTLTMKFAVDPQSPFSAHAEAHGEVSLNDVKSLSKPTLFCCAANDHAFPETRIVEAEKILGKLPQNSHKVIRYPDTYHGFAVRGDDKNQHIASAKKACMHDVVDFFSKNFTEN